MERVIVYVDGFNLYHGIRQKRWRDVLWLDLAAFSRALLKDTQQLERVKYFTARVSAPPDKVKRQQAFLDATETLEDVQVFLGRYQLDTWRCSNCGYQNRIPHEKMTDVNIATELMTDAFEGRFDTALLVTADADLVGPVNAVRSLFPRKRVVAAFPPARASKYLAKVASAYFHIGRDKLLKSQFPDRLSSSGGFVLQRPEKWR